MPVPDTNGEEWDRLEPASALDAVVELALHGEYNGLDGGKRFKDGLELRAAAASVFEVTTNCTQRALSDLSLRTLSVKRIFDKPSYELWFHRKEAVRPHLPSVCIL